MKIVNVSLTIQDIVMVDSTSVVFSGKGLQNNIPVVGVFDISIQQIVWQEYLPMAFINSIMYESTSDVMFIIGKDNNNQLVTLSIQLSTKHMVGRSIHLSGQIFSLDPSYGK